MFIIELIKILDGNGSNTNWISIHEDSGEFFNY
jgi:hypothetical protein